MNWVLDYYQTTVQLIGRRLSELQQQFRYDEEVAAADKKQILDAMTTIIAELADLRQEIRARL